jgi:single stranded DNA-binding protein
MADLNVVFLTGRLGREVEITESENARFGKSTLAVTGEKWGDKEPPVYWYNIEMSGKKRDDGKMDRAGFFKEYFKKGYRVAVTGMLIEESWNDNETGAKKSRTKIRITDISRAEYAKADEAGGGMVNPALKAAAAFLKTKPELAGEFKTFLAAAQAVAKAKPAPAQTAGPDIPDFPELEEDDDYPF